MSNFQLAELVQKIAYCEKNVELARKALASLYYFNAEVAFDLLDNNGNELVCEKELLNFFNKYGVNTSLDERLHILHLVKSEQPLRGIDYQAFIKIFLPATSGAESDLAQTQQVDDEDRENANRQIEKAMGLFLMKEIEMYNYLEESKGSPGAMIRGRIP
jgi:hypothetical protein